MLDNSLIITIKLTSTPLQPKHSDGAAVAEFWTDRSRKYQIPGERTGTGMWQLNWLVVVGIGQPSWVAGNVRSRYCRTMERNMKHKRFVESFLFIWSFLHYWRWIDKIHF